MNSLTTTKKKAFLLLACVWFIITFSVVQTTYAKYVTNFDANTNISISYWNIKVNNQDIIQDSDLSGYMTPVLLGNDFTKADVIVPGATGYFNLNIDSSKINVPFTVTITSSINESSSLTTDFVISGYSIDGGTVTSITPDSSDITAEDTVTFSTDIAQETDSTLITVFTTWLDDGVDSVEDTTLGISGGTAILDINLKFEQNT